jgi:UPF0042 nucleotide-binding protein
MKILMVSGRSGSGKSTALHIMEDLGYYCIDNLPLNLLNAAIENLQPNFNKVAISIDVRNLTKEPKNFESIYLDLKNHAQDCQIIFVDAADDILLQRFSETRRKHPLTHKNLSLQESLALEKKILQPIANQADLLIDTSYQNSQQLRNSICDRLAITKNHLSLLFQSFGFKNGAPKDSDFIFDVRCLPNPHWEKQLRHLTGLDSEVKTFLAQFPEIHKMYAMIRNFINTWLPNFALENRKYLTISIGCTGGQHRSVYLAEKLKRYFSKLSDNVAIRHRDLKQDTNNH